MDIESALKRPFTDIKNLIIGCALNVIPIVNFFSTGYAAEAAKLTLKRKNNLPAWENWSQLFLQGLLIIIIGFLYLIPMFLALLGGGISIFTKKFLTTLVDSNNFQMMVTGLGIGAGLVALFLGLTAAYLLPAAVLGYISTGKFGQVFNFRTVFKKSFRGNYFLAWVVSFIISTVLILFLGWIPLVGMAVASFTALIMNFTLIAEAYRQK